jgi:hypothetical protein
MSSLAPRTALGMKRISHFGSRIVPFVTRAGRCPVRCGSHRFHSLLTIGRAALMSTRPNPVPIFIRSAIIWASSRADFFSLAIVIPKAPLLANVWCPLALYRLFGPTRKIRPTPPVAGAGGRSPCLASHSDQFVGADNKRLRNREAERFCSLEI